MSQNECLITRIHMIGKPGTGKDTQATIIKEFSPETTDIVSTGDIFRGAKSSDGKYGQYYPLLKPYISDVNQGNYIPDNVIVGIVNTDLQERLKIGFTTLIYTGYPRTVNQLYEINRTSEEELFLNLYIYYRCSTEIARERVLNRRNEFIKAGKIPRDEDNPETFEKRIKAFNKNTVPLIRELRQQNSLITIEANGTIMEIAEITRRKLDNLK